MSTTKGTSRLSKIDIVDNSKAVLLELEFKVDKALETCGLMAEGYAKRLCAVDTGLLRNSISHALGGEPSSIGVYTDNPQKQSGSYSGSTPEDAEGQRTMYLGTNVEYAPYVEMGTVKTKAQPFIKPAVANHGQQYMGVINKILKE